MRRAAWMLLGLLAATVLAGCGYRFLDTAGHLPGDVERLHIPLFTNRTLEPLVENALSDAVVREFARRRAVRVVPLDAEADARLEGVLVSYGNSAISYSASDDIVQYRVTLVVDATLRRLPDRAVLWKSRFTRAENYRASTDKAVQEDQEAAAAREAAQRLAEDLYSRLALDF